MIHSGICHGTLGEIFQGPYLRNGELHISLVSLPVRKYSCAHFVRSQGNAGPGAARPWGRSDHLDPGLTDKPKCRKAIEAYLLQHRRALPAGRWSFDSELLQGKGMASSTADIVAVIRCLDRLFDLRSSQEVISGILRQVERSDSVFLDTYALYLSAQQEVVRYFESDTSFHACYIDEGTAVDTEMAGQPLIAHYERHLPDYLKILERTIEAFMRRDLRAIGRCATESAVLAQGVLPKKNLQALLSAQAHHRADGIVVAHTGSLLGYLFIRKPGHAEMAELSSFFRGLGYASRFVQTGF